LSSACPAEKRHAHLYADSTRRRRATKVLPHLQEDLIDGWTLIREWGYQGAGGRMIKDHFTDREQAEQAMIDIRDAQLKKGYQVVFMQAQT